MRKGDAMTKYGMVIDMTRCTGCQTCVVTCQMNNNQRPSVKWSSVDIVEQGEYPEGDRFFLPHACMHCDDAPCVHACPTGASSKRPDGIVTVNYDACLACGACVMVCPYDARTISFKDEWYFNAAEAAPYESYGTPHVDVAEKCIFCHERVDAGEQPHCVAACPMAARVFGDLDDPSSEINTYIKENNAENLRGTALYYVKGPHNIDVREALMTNLSNVPSIVLSEKDAPGPEGEPQGVNAAAIGVGAVAVAAVAAGGGFAAGNVTGKKKAAGSADGKDGE